MMQTGRTEPKVSDYHLNFCTFFLQQETDLTGITMNILNKMTYNYATVNSGLLIWLDKRRSKSADI